MKNTPLISVIIAIYNGEKYIKNTIESVISQTYLNWELIIVNDGSQDNSLNIINSFLSLDDRVHVINLDTNSGGPAHPRNIGIKEAKGSYIAFLDSDDIWHKEKLKCQLEFIEKEKLDLVHCQVEYIDREGNESGSIKKSRMHSFISGVFGNLSALLVINPVALSSCLIRNEGGFFFRINQNFQSIEDWALWIDLCISGKKLGELNQRLVFYRVHDSSISSINGITQYFKSFHLYSALLVEKKIGFFKYLILFFIHLIRVLKFQFFGRH